MIKDKDLPPHKGSQGPPDSNNPTSSEDIRRWQAAALKRRARFRLIKGGDFDSISRLPDDELLALYPDYRFFVRDGTYFRRLPGKIGPAVHEILRIETGEWVAYDGDCYEPVFFGDEIAEADLPKPGKG